MIGLLKRFLIRHLFLLFFIRSLCLEHSSSDESDESDKEEYDELGSESGSDGKFGTVLGGLLRGVGLPLCVTLSADDSCDGDGGSLVK